MKFIITIISLLISVSAFAEVNIEVQVKPGSPRVYPFFDVTISTNEGEIEVLAPWFAVDYVITNKESSPVEIYCFNHAIAPMNSRFAKPVDFCEETALVIQPGESYIKWLYVGDISDNRYQTDYDVYLNVTGSVKGIDFVKSKYFTLH
ncbi:MAG: hypothetical protein KDD50_01785 [Bdellovibrionales bacterium]|nr:hypothetical protein [Bdellovibrionales bacterium]